jgi:hypothetical protein
MRRAKGPWPRAGLALGIVLPALALGGCECGGDDCDDADADRFPGNAEVCNRDGEDDACNPATFGNRDADQDGYVSDAWTATSRCSPVRSAACRVGKDSSISSVGPRARG